MPWISELAVVHGRPGQICAVVADAAALAAFIRFPGRDTDLTDPRGCDLYKFVKQDDIGQIWMLDSIAPVSWMPVSGAGVDPATLAAAIAVALGTNYVKRDGTLSMTGALSFGTNKLADLGAPTLPSDAARLDTVTEAISAALGGVSISGTPTTGQIPVATSGTTATWQTNAPAWSNVSSKPSVNTTAPLAGGGSLSSSLTLSVAVVSNTTSGVISLITGANYVLRTSDGVAASWGQIGNSYISDVAWSKVSSTPTTLTGYGITNGVSTARTISTTAPITIDGTSSADLSSNRTIAVTNATTGAVGVVQLAGDIGGTGTSVDVLKAHGATIPAAGSLTTSHVLQVSGASALTYGYVANANISASAAIVVTKLELGGTSQFITCNGSTNSWAAMSDTLHGTRGGGTLHATVNGTNAGFAPAMGTAYRVLGTYNGTTPAWIQVDNDVISATAAIAWGKLSGYPMITCTAPLTIAGTTFADLSTGRTLAINNATTGAVGVIQLAGDLAGSGTSVTVAKINGASVPAAGSLTTNHVLMVTGASALGYNYISNANIATGAAIDPSKFAYGTSNQVIASNGSAAAWTTFNASIHGSLAGGLHSLVSGTTAGEATSINGTNTVFLSSDGTSGSWAKITNSNISASAVIDVTKLALGSANQVLTSNGSTNSWSSVTNAMLAGSISWSKLTSYPTITCTAPLTIAGGASADLSTNRTLAVSNATTGAVGVVQLAGDLQGSATTPTVKSLTGTSGAVAMAVPILSVSGTELVLYQTGDSQGGSKAHLRNRPYQDGLVIENLGVQFCGLSFANTEFPIDSPPGPSITMRSTASGYYVNTGELEIGKAGTPGLVVGYNVPHVLISSTGVAVAGASIKFESAVSAPVISQTDRTSGNADSLTIFAQSATGTGSVGGALYLRSGVGALKNGTIDIYCGPTVLVEISDSTQLAQDTFSARCGWVGAYYGYAYASTLYRKPSFTEGQDINHFQFTTTSTATVNSDWDVSGLPDGAMAFDFEITARGGTTNSSWYRYNVVKSGSTLTLGSRSDLAVALSPASVPSITNPSTTTLRWAITPGNSTSTVWTIKVTGRSA